MIYLASPYTEGGASETVMRNRYHQAMDFVVARMPEPIFSPIVYSHNMGVTYDLPKTFDFWMNMDYKFIDACDTLYVLMLAGWDKSIGVTAEIEYAKKKGLDIVFFNSDHTRYSV